MNKYYISVGSVTHAMKGRNLLNARGFRAVVKRSTQSEKREGCGYTIVIEGISDIEKILSILRSNNIRILGFGEYRDTQ